MSDTITVQKRFCGPPESGNGGYVCGLLAKRFTGPVEVTLRAPPPLDHSMKIEGDIRHELRVVDDGQLVAQARSADLELDIPELPEWEQVIEAGAGYPGFKHHLYPECFVCGPHREPGDGLRIFAGPVKGSEVFAAVWVPGVILANKEAKINSEFVWAALDCPGYFAVTQDAEPMLLGRLTLECEGDLYPGEEYIVLAWPLGQEGRKHFAGTAVFDRDGRRLARARAVWVSLPA